MDIKDLMADVRGTPGHIFERKLNDFVRRNHSFKNLDENNKGLIRDMVGKYRKNYLMNGRKVPSDTLRRDMYNLSQNRQKLGMSENDLKDIRDIMSEFGK
jgi:hypothetical protein